MKGAPIAICNRGTVSIKESFQVPSLSNVRSLIIPLGKSNGHPPINAKKYFYSDLVGRESLGDNRLWRLSGRWDTYSCGHDWSTGGRGPACGRGGCPACGGCGPTGGRGPTSGRCPTSGTPGRSGGSGRGCRTLLESSGRVRELVLCTTYKVNKTKN